MSDINKTRAKYLLKEPRHIFGVCIMDLSFSEVLNALKNGKKAARSGWNGKGMFIYMVKGSEFEVSRPPLLGILPEGATAQYHSHIDMKLADDTFMSWTPSDVDLFTEDWFLVD